MTKEKIRGETSSNGSSSTFQDTVKKSHKSQPVETPYTTISNKTSIKVLDISKRSDSTSRYFSMYKNSCDKWSLSANDIIHIVKSSTEITGEDFHHYYDVLPCYYAGELSVNEKRVPFEINAGSFIILTYKDTTVYLGYTRNDLKKFFVIGPGID
jgi:hypothetical protein